MPANKRNAKVVSFEVEIDRAIEKGSRVAARTAVTISRALDKMIADLPELAASQMATLRLVRELTRLQPTQMQRIMDDHLAREAYEASIAELPATPGRIDF
jgi:hypothetical protein